MSRKVGIILTAIIAVIVGLWLWAGIIPKNSTQIGGSTSVDPVMQRLTNTYKNNYHGDSFIYSSSGSTGGVNNAKSGTYKIGFISRALDNSADYVNTTFNDKQTINSTNVTDKNYKEFGNQIYKYLIEPNKYTGDQMHYVQVATDAIIVTYDAPDWFKNNFSNDFNITFDANGKVNEEWQDIIQGIYSGNWTWTDVANQMVKDNNKLDASKIVKESKDNVITPFAREPGSGTRNSFDNMFGLKNMTSPSKATEYNSNGMMYNNFRLNTFGYMSLNYLGQIQGNDSLETARVNGIDPHDAKKFKMSMVDSNTKDGKEYTLTRPYIGLIKWNLEQKELKKISNFLAWIATAQPMVDKQTSSDSNDAYSQFLKAGLKPEFKLDDPTIPGASTNVKPAKQQLANQTNVVLKRTISEGYLPRH